MSNFILTLGLYALPMLVLLYLWGALLAGIFVAYVRSTAIHLTKLGAATTNPRMAQRLSAATNLTDNTILIISLIWPILPIVLIEFLPGPHASKS